MLTLPGRAFMPLSLWNVKGPLLDSLSYLGWLLLLLQPSLSMRCFIAGKCCLPLLEAFLPNPSQHLGLASGRHANVEFSRAAQL